MNRRNRTGTYSPVMARERIIASASFLPLAFLLLLLVGWVPKTQAAPTLANFIGEVERITIDNPLDHYSGGTIVVGGQVVILPRNLLLDLPANRLTLKQLFDQAPAACIANGETGLAKADACNTSGTGAIATMSGNRSDFGNVIAGDVLISKGLESITGFVTFINYDQGYYRVDGQPGVDNAGVIVRLNDPGARHTVQSGIGCLAGSENCSPDPRFTLDPDNYTNVFSNGFPYCLPSTATRTFTNVLGDNVTTSVAAADGTGDYLCPDTNRPASLNTPAADSRRFAPLKVGDSINAEGNFETISGVRFLSSHSSTIGVALPSKVDVGQPDYFFLAEVFMDAPAFFNARYRSLVIGYTTLANPVTDVLFWTIHRDKVTNEIHEVPWATVVGCDAAGGAGTCTSQGLAGAGGNIFRIRHDVDFILGNVGPLRFGSADPRLSPCAHLRLETRFGNPSPFCPSATAAGAPGDETGSLAEEFGTFSPIPHEIMGRTGKKLADAGATKSIDVSGLEATWGEYLFPFGVNLGGISLQEMNEIDLNLMATPNVFEGIPWNLDRRLGPGGCNGACEADVPGDPYAYALDPFPYSGLHPKTALTTLVGGGAGSGLPTGQYNDPNFTASALTDVRDRMFSFVNASGVFDGNNTVIDSTLLANLTPPEFPIVETPPLPLAPPPPATSATLSANLTSPQNAGASILFTATAAGGSGSYQYRFVGRKIGTTPIFEAQPYGTANTWAWNTTTVAAGTYEFQAYARSVGSTAPVEAVSEPVIFSIVIPGVDNVSLAPAPASPQNRGTSVVFTATPTGGTAPVQYQFWGRVAGAATFSLAQGYSTSNTFTWNTGTVPAGNYEWQVFARSAGSTAVSEAVSAIVPYTLTAVVVDNVSLATDLASPQNVGASIVFTATPTGGTAPVQYQFWGKVAGAATFSLAQGYSTSNTFTWNTGTVPAGDYEWQVFARSAGSTAVSEAVSTIVPYTLNP